MSVTAIMPFQLEKRDEQLRLRQFQDYGEKIRTGLSARYHYPDGCRQKGKMHSRNRQAWNISRAESTLPVLRPRLDQVGGNSWRFRDETMDLKKCA